MVRRGEDGRGSAQRGSASSGCASATGESPIPVGVGAPGSRRRANGGRARRPSGTSKARLEARVAQRGAESTMSPGAWALLIPLATLAAGCNSGEQAACSGLCLTSVSASLTLACAPAALVSATLDGPCAGDASPTGGFSCANRNDVPFVDCAQVEFGAGSPGDCQVELSFADGFSYSSTVTFTSVSQSCGCPPVAEPTPSSLIVKNPQATCLVDASTD
jgi:hypothetical protein